MWFRAPRSRPSGRCRWSTRRARIRKPRRWRSRRTRRGRSGRGCRRRTPRLTGTSPRVGGKTGGAADDDRGRGVGAGGLRGFSIMVVRPSSLFRARIANQDLLWLVPEFRGRSVGARFLGWCDEQLRQDGVEVIYRHTRLVKDFGGLLERMGYEEIDRSFGRR